MRVNCLKVKSPKDRKQCKCLVLGIQLAFGDVMSRLGVKAVGEDGINTTVIGLASVSGENVWNDLSILLGEMECQPQPA